VAVLDPMEIYDRGLRDLASLQGAERLLFMLQDFDNLMEMEGWEHFFLYEHHFIWYAEMKEWLHTIGENSSLAVLQNYESYLKARGVALSPSAIENSDARGEAHSLACNDLCNRYCELRSVRWARAAAHLESQGVRIEM
jgi:hypothetical protein